MIPGITINIGGTDYVVPPLNFALLKELGALRRAQPAKVVDGADIVDGLLDDMSYYAPILAKGLQQNYPDVTVDVVLSGLNTVNYRQLHAAVYGREVTDDVPLVTVASS